MLTYYPSPQGLEGILGLSYSLLSGQQSVSLQLPALAGQIQVVLAGGWRFRSAASIRTAAIGAQIVGPTSCACNVEIEPSTVAIGVGLPPAGWHLLIGVPAHCLVDRACDMRELWGASFSDALLNALLWQTTDLEQATHCLLTFLRLQLGEMKRKADPRLVTVEQWAAEAHRSSLDQLCRYLNLGQRQVSRVTTDAYGFGPKQLQIRYRALRLAARINFSSSTHNWSGEEMDGYCDQSHLIRSFTTFVGTTPGNYRRDAAAFGRSMLIGRWNAGARLPSTLWS